MALLEWFLETSQNELVGLIGGAIFFGSWMLQAWETRLAGKPTVSARFFVLRSIASLLMALEGLRAGSISIFIVMAATLVLMLYNLKSAIKVEARERQLSKD
ncbi:hypothetical protein [Kiloniella sp.]|uniref:hypothetical protein n=1 Tax=Kiloniella sp. TaxID=1938587 RepID=UPI003B02BB5B